MVFRPCAPCPLTCDDISGQASCPPDRPCSSPGEGDWAGSVEALLCMMPNAGLYLGCWCPEGKVLNTEGRCVRPRQCPCLVDGARYWPGQRIKMDCQLCFCQDGQPHRCRPNPECAGKPLFGRSLGMGMGWGCFLSRPPSPDFCCLSVDCGWSSWSPWAECLGPCSSQSLQWSFRSPNNPRLSEHGRQCRGIHRKARRYRIGTQSILYPCLGGRLRFPL